MCSGNWYWLWTIWEVKKRRNFSFVQASDNSFYVIGGSDENDNVLPKGVEGEICLIYDLYSRYFKDDEKSAKISKTIRDILQEDKGGFSELNNLNIGQYTGYNFKNKNYIEKIKKYAPIC